MPRKQLLFILILSVLSFEGAHAQPDVFETLLLEETSLSIAVTSNVSDFTCTYLDPMASDTLVHEVVFSDSLFLSGDGLVLTSNRFDCGSRSVNRDMRKTLKADEFPFLELNLHSIEIADSLPFTTVLDVFIAGVGRKEQLNIVEFTRFENQVSLTGLATILLSDYNLKTPTALFGLVRVDDAVQIRYDIFYEQNKR